MKTKYESKLISFEPEYVGEIVVGFKKFEVRNPSKRINKKLSNCEKFQEEVLDSLNANELEIEE